MSHHWYVALYLLLSVASFISGRYAKTDGERTRAHVGTYALLIMAQLAVRP